MSDSDGESIEAKVLHPRRSLGTRYRTQAERFLKSERPTDTIWGEQMASKAVLHDFTDPENWRVLVRSRAAIGDEAGVFASLKDLFTVLGRDPDLTDLLVDVDILEHGLSILEEALRIDPLDPDDWWSLEKPAEDLLDRIKSLDFSDHRANLLFSRRLERLLANGMEDEYLEHAPILLAQRPLNHEAWTKLGRIHERKGHPDKAWHCYDQAQIAHPACGERDRFRQRMEDRLDGESTKPWRRPSVGSRSDFLDGLRRFAGKEKEKDDIAITEDPDTDGDPIRSLMSEGRLPEAFFLARRRAAEGVDGAESLLHEIKGMME